jgi:hypothetical protein
LLLLLIVTAAIINGRFNVDSQGIIIIWLFIVTAGIIDGRFNVDSQGIIICLFIVTAAIIDGRFESRHRKDELVQHITSGAGIVVGPVWTFCSPDLKCHVSFCQYEEEFKDTKEVIRIRKSK